MVNIFWDKFNIVANFLSPEVKRSAVIVNKGGGYEFLYELLNDFKLRILGN